MSVGTSDGEYHESDFDYWHSQLFGKQQSTGQQEDKLDFTDKFNTPLSPEQQTQYDKQFTKDDSYDYDMQGWFKANGGERHEGGEHYPDTWKKPNHPTFSDESIYHGKDNHEGGQWDLEGGRYSFSPGRTNLKYHSTQDLIDYFQKYDKNIFHKNNSTLFELHLRRQ